MSGLLHHLLHPTNCYALCAVARSGAHLLTAGLRATHLAGRPMQYFHEHLAPKYALRYGVQSSGHFVSYVRGIVVATATRNSVFGFRLDASYLNPFLGRLRDSGAFGKSEAPDIELLRSAFPGLRCIQLTREDKLRQAISKARAMQTGCWVLGKGEATAEPVFDPTLIEECLLSASRSEHVWADFFQRNEIDPLAITYENLCTQYPETVARVLDFLRIRPPRSFSLGPPRTVRQADAITEEWLRRYREVQALRRGRASPQ